MNSKYTIIEDLGYDNPNSKIKCKNCGHIFTASIHNINRKNAKVCPYCEVVSKNCTQDEIEYKLKSIGEDYTILKFNGLEKESIVKHNPCGSIIENAKLTRILNRNTKKCINCSHRSTAYTTDYVKNEIKNLTNGEYIMLGEYKSENTPFLIKHETCGNSWNVRRRNFIYKGT